MGSFWAAALAQVRSWPRDRLFIWLLLIAPLSGMVILDGLFADGLLRRLPVAVCDLDGSSTSRELIRRVDALPSARVLRRCSPHRTRAGTPSAVARSSPCW